MARYLTRVATPLAADDAFATIADLTSSFAGGTRASRRSVQVAGDGSGWARPATSPWRRFPETSPLRYGWSARPPHLPRRGPQFGVRRPTASPSATRRWRVDRHPDAELTLNGPLGLFDPALRLAFGAHRRPGAAGLRGALDGTAVDR